MQILEAINELKNAIGIACNAGHRGGSDSSGSLGDDISESIVSFTPSEVAGLSIQSLDPKKNCVPERIQGGDVLIQFVGEQQPEAARTLDSVLTPILNRVLIAGEINYRRKTKQFTEDRILPFHVPDNRAADLVEQLIEMTRLIRSNPQLRQQFTKGNELSLEHLNKVDGVKPYVELVLPEQRVNKCSYEVTPPHFRLRMEGVPAQLARGIATILKLDYEDLPATRSTTSRDHSRSFVGGKAISVRLDHDKMPIIEQEIKTFCTDIYPLNNPEGNRWTGRGR